MPVKVVGLTGGIGSGKTTVGALLVEKGATLVDADTIVREVQEPGTPVFQKMVERFGEGIVGGDGRLDRQAVADIVFNDAEALAALNGIVHPAVGVEILQRIAAHEGTDDIVIADIPLLAEGKSQIAMSGVIVVDVPPELQIERLVAFRGFAEADARARIAKQATREDRLAKADRVIDNSGPPEALRPQVDDVWNWITTLPDTAGAVTPSP